MCSRALLYCAEMELQRKLHDQDKKAVEGLTRDRDLLKKEEMRARQFADKQTSLVKTHEQSIRCAQTRRTNTPT